MFSKFPMSSFFFFLNSKYILQRTSQVAQIIKKSAYNAEDPGLIPRLGKSPEEKHGYSVQYSCLENPHGWRNLAGCNPWGHKKSDMNEKLTCPHHILQNWEKALYMCVLKLHIYVRGCLPILFPHVVCPAPVHLARESHIIFLHLPLDGILCQDRAGPMGELKRILRKYLLPEFSAQPGASKVKG